MTMMVDPKPLFDDETPDDPVPPSDNDGKAPHVAAQDEARPIQVVALDLSGTDHSPAPAVEVAPLEFGADPQPAASQPGVAMAIDESPAVAQAMRQGLEKFPQVMSTLAYLVRNDLNEILPVEFQKVAEYGSDTLTRAADLIAQVARLGPDLHEIDAENLLRTIVEHANGEHKKSVFGLLAHSFDAQATSSQLAAIAQAIRSKLAHADELADLLTRVHTTLIAKTTAIDIVSDMAELSQLGDVVTRKATALSASRQQIQLAIQQVGNLRKQAEEWIMRADEIRTLTLPAMGFLGSL
jgi:hypothetical protein